MYFSNVFFSLQMSHILFALLSLFSFAALLEAQWKLRENGKQSSLTETYSWL